MAFIDDLELSVRAGNVLRRIDPNMTRDEFLALDRRTVLSGNGAGIKTWREIALVQAGLRERLTETLWDDGGPAYPVLDDAGAGLQLRHSGMSLREAAALAALPAIIAATSQGLHMPGQRGTLASQPIEDRMAADAFRIADAFIAAREAGEK